MVRLCDVNELLELQNEEHTRKHTRKTNEGEVFYN